MELLIYLGERLASALDGQFSTTTPLDPTGGPAIMLGKLPDEFAAGVAMMPYQVDEDVVYAEGVEGVQLRYRGTFDQVMDFRQKVLDDLHGLHSVTVSATLVIEQVYRQSSTSIGYDANQRLNWTDNYYVQRWAPATNRL